MNQEQIKTLIDALFASDRSELEYSENGSTLRLVKQSALAATGASARSSRGARSGGALGRTRARRINSACGSCGRMPGSALRCGASPAHAREPPFVQGAQAVKAGQTLCVIEAMKVFNEVRAERDATLQAGLRPSATRAMWRRPTRRCASAPRRRGRAV
jgi:acetyl-CoA carboxylase biotin carboxyl carrier protein